MQFISRVVNQTKYLGTALRFFFNELFPHFKKSLLVLLEASDNGHPERYKYVNTVSGLVGNLIPFYSGVPVCLWNMELGVGWGIHRGLGSFLGRR